MHGAQVIAALRDYGSQHVWRATDDNSRENPVTLNSIWEKEADNCGMPLFGMERVSSVID